MDFHKALGRVIRGKRHARSLTLREVALTGFVSMGHLSDVENGRKEGSSQFIKAVATALKLEPYDLVLEAGYLMAGSSIPNTPEKLYVYDSFKEKARL